MYWRFATAASIALISFFWVRFRQHPTISIPGDLFIEEKLRFHGIVPTSNRNENVNSQPTSGDTTAVLLNWSRLENVVLIVAALCSNVLDDVISQVFIWNNNPNVKLAPETFRQSNCPNSRLRIYNSPKNLYFRARFLACEQSGTPYCFIQDDDYLVHPAVVRNVHDYILIENFTHPLYLLPPEEHLRSRARTIITEDTQISTSFAWLGHGAYVPRSAVQRFLEMMEHLNMSSEEKKMSDNYFSILYNRVAEVWFDHSIPLGGGQPFTVGSEGEARNDRHIMNAIRYLRQTVSEEQATSPQAAEVLRDHAACRELSCVIHTNISFVPETFHRKVGSELGMLTVAGERMSSLDPGRLLTYVTHPLSHAVDQNPNTAFISQMVAQRGDQIVLDLLHPIHEENACLEIAILTDMASCEILSRCHFSLSADNTNWHAIEDNMGCTKDDASSNGVHVGLYKYSVGQKRGLAQRARFARVQYNGDESTTSWTIHEMWVQERQCIPSHV